MTTSCQFEKEYFAMKVLFHVIHIEVAIFFPLSDSLVQMESKFIKQV